MDQPTVIWGARAIAAAINAPLRKTFALLETGNLPAGKIGRIWFSTPERLRQFLNARIDDAIAAADTKPTSKPTSKPNQPKRTRRAKAPVRS